MTLGQLISLPQQEPVFCSFCSRRSRSKNRKTFDTSGEKLNHPRQVWDGKRIMEKRNGKGPTGVRSLRAIGNLVGFCFLAEIGLAFLRAQAAPMQLMSAGPGPFIDIKGANAGDTCPSTPAEPFGRLPGCSRPPTAEPADSFAAVRVIICGCRRGKRCWRCGKRGTRIAERGVSNPDFAAGGSRPRPRQTARRIRRRYGSSWSAPMRRHNRPGWSDRLPR